MKKKYQFLTFKLFDLHELQTFSLAQSIKQNRTLLPYSWIWEIWMGIRLSNAVELANLLFVHIMKLTGSTTLNFPLVFVLLFNMYSKIEIQMVFWPEVLLYLLAV